MQRKLPFHLVYHDGYDLNFGTHVFPSSKYRLVRSRLLREEFAGMGDFADPESATDDQLRLVHTGAWISKLQNGTLNYMDLLRLEIPYSRQMVHAFWLAAGGTTLAARLALKERVSFNIGGGFHHAFPDHGEGFCAIHDVAVAIRVLQQEGCIRKAMVVDCDVHQGNGTAAIFAGDANVFTLSIHQLNNYPDEKPPSTVDINLEDGLGDSGYLDHLRGPYETAIDGFRPDILFYVAGADPYYEDQLGGLSLTIEGLMLRDRLVLDPAIRLGIPVAVVLAGGYAVELSDTVRIHANTAIACAQALAGQ